MQQPFDLNLLKTQTLCDARRLRAEAEAARLLKKAGVNTREEASGWKQRLSIWIAEKLAARSHPVGPAS